MTQRQIVNAYKTLRKLSGKELPIIISCKIHRLTVSLRPAWDFQCNEEQKIFERLKPKILPNGDLEFSTTEDAREFKTRMKEIGDMEVDDVKFTSISIPETIDAELTPADIENLDGFIEFTEV